MKIYKKIDRAVMLSYSHPFFAKELDVIFKNEAGFDIRNDFIDHHKAKQPCLVFIRNAFVLVGEFSLIYSEKLNIIELRNRALRNNIDEEYFWKLFYESSGTGYIFKFEKARQYGMTLNLNHTGIKVKNNYQDLSEEEIAILLNTRNEENKHGNFEEYK